MASIKVSLVSGSVMLSCWTQSEWTCTVEWANSGISLKMTITPGILVLLSCSGVIPLMDGQCFLIYY